MNSDSPLPIAIVGLGFGRLIVQNLQKPELRHLFRVTAVSDLDTDKATEVAAEIGVKALTLEELLADPAYPIIGLFSGPAGRAELVRRCIRAGKDVMTTKPFERSSAAAKEVLAEAAQLGRIVHLNSPGPSLPADLACIREWQVRHDLGRPLAGDFSSWAHYSEKADGRWLDDPALCPVAPIFRLGIYMINDAIELFGAPEEVLVMSSRLFTGRPTPDHAQLGIRFQNGALCHMFASFCIRDGDWYRDSLTLNFERGTIYRNAGAAGKEGAAATLSLIVEKDNKPFLAEKTRISLSSGHYQWENFHQAVLSRQLPPPEMPEKVAAGLRVIEAMADAEKLGRPVKVAAC